MNREHSCIINKWLRWWCLGNISYLDECSQSVVHRPVVSASPGSLLKMQILGQPHPHPRRIESETESEKSNLCFIKSFQRCWRMINLRTTGFRDMSNLAHSLFFVSQILLKHSHFHSFTYCVGCFCTITAVLSSCKRDLIANKAYNILFSGPLKEKPCDPLV